MRGVKRFRVHPLFFAAGILSAFTGELLLFAAAVLAAVEHECAHAFAARRYGYSLDSIVLMPYGAVVSGDLSGMTRREEIAVALAGPLANAATALLFAALWWIFPETYPYTDAAAFVSLSLFLVNLLPAFPLDGGRILYAALSPLGSKRARTVCRAVTLAIAGTILGYFVYTCFSAPAFSALFFAAALLFGAFGGGKYRPAVLCRRNFSRGVEERRVALSADGTLRDALRYLSEDKYLTLLLFEDGEFLGEVGEEEYLRAVEEGDYARPLRTLLSEM